jgi:hypothetical protein
MTGDSQERSHSQNSISPTPSYLALDEIRRDGGTQPEQPST